MTSCRRAIRASDAPGASVSSTIRRFSSVVRRRRPSALAGVALSKAIVSVHHLDLMDTYYVPVYYGADGYLICPSNLKA